jgi:hypothetical protein
MAKLKGDLAKEPIKLPVARLINHSLFVKDAYKDPTDPKKESKPRYKAEIAFAKDDKAFEDFLARLLDIADQEFPGKNYSLDIDGGDLISGLIDGNQIAADRESRGKKGDAYKGMWVIRASTQYNYSGEDADGGAQVYDEQAKRIDAIAGDRSQIYSGCFGHLAVKVGVYDREDVRSKKKFDCFNYYLVAFQKTSDGEKLATGGDASALFKPVGNDGKGKLPERRRRPG